MKVISIGIEEIETTFAGITNQEILDLVNYEELGYEALLSLYYESKALQFLTTSNTVKVNLENKSKFVVVWYGSSLNLNKKFSEEDPLLWKFVKTLLLQG